MSFSLRVGFLGVKINVDVLQVLINVFMFVNFSLWFQWDIIFVFILGFFLSWLEREGFKGNIYILVIDVGVIFKIDGIVIVDNFFLLLISGDLKFVVVQFMFIVVLYGGINYVLLVFFKMYVIKVLIVLICLFVSEVYFEDYSRVVMLLLDILCVVLQEFQFFVVKIFLLVFLLVVEYFVLIFFKFCKIDEY